jgi:hypothetical protein
MFFFLFLSVFSIMIYFRRHSGIESAWLRLPFWHNNKTKSNFAFPAFFLYPQSSPTETSLNIQQCYKELDWSGF